MIATLTTDRLIVSRAAFEVHNGIWRGAPISIGRFAANSDPYFASIIASTINT